MNGLEQLTDQRRRESSTTASPKSPEVSYAICTNPRSGSWLLSEGLASTKLVGNPREWFHHSQEEQLRELWRPELGALNYEQYLEKVFDFASTPNRIFGVKLHYYQFAELPRKMSEVDRLRGLGTPELLAQMFPNLHYIWLTRRDKVRQALSYYRASRTQQWWDIGTGPAGTPQLDLADIARKEEELVENDAQWNGYFEQNGINPLVVAYEELAADYGGTIRHILGWLGVPDADNAVVPPPRLRKQSDEITESWLPAYLKYRSEQGKAQGDQGARSPPPVAPRQVVRPIAAQPAKPTAVAPARATAPAPAAVAGALPDAWKTWIGANRLRGAAESVMIDTLVSKGFARDVAAAEVTRAASDPYLRAARQSQERLDKALALMKTLTNLRAMNSTSSAIERRSGLSRQQFVDEYFSCNRPVLLDGLMNDWPAMTRWTPDYLKATIGDEVVEVMVDRNDDPLYERNLQKHRLEIRFSEYVDRVYGGGATNDYYLVANNGFFQRPGVRPLLDDIHLFPEYLKGDGSQGVFLWFGPGGTITPLHRDTSNIFMAQVSGRKHVKLVPSIQWPFLYNNVGVFSDVDPETPDFERFPEFRKATVIDVVLEPGDVLFMPVGWWHYVRAIDPSIMLSFTNFDFTNHAWPA